ncbi:MAG: transposase [Acidobacteriota bacterium]
MAPGNNESAGVRKRAPTMKGNPHIKAALVESGWAASRTKDTEFQERYDRLKTRIGHKRAIVAAAHLLALHIYEVLSKQQPYDSKRPPRICAAIIPAASKLLIDGFQTCPLLNDSNGVFRTTQINAATIFGPVPCPTAC